MIKKKVLLVAPFHAQKVGGIGTWTKNILEQAKANGDKIAFLNTMALLIKPNIVKSRMHRIVMGMLDSLIILVSLIWKLIVKRPDVVHYTSSASMALHKDIWAVRISRFMGARFVIHFHFGRIPELAVSRDNEWRNLCQVIRAANEVIVIDDQSYEVLIKEGFTNIHNIPNPISASIEKLSKEITDEAAGRIKGHLLFVGHVIPTKGVEELVTACVGLEEVLQLNVVGPYKTDYRDQLESIAKRKKDGQWVKFWGELPREDVFQYFRTTSLFVLPSYTEGFPNVILESMAFACPIVATPVGAIPQMLMADTSCAAGVIVDVKNVQQLSDAIKKMIDNPTLADTLGANARKKVLREYTLEKSYSQLKQIWEE